MGSGTIRPSKTLAVTETILRCCLIFAVIFSLKLPSGHARITAERMSNLAGKTETYTSDNGSYTVTITYGNNSASWSMKEHGYELWNKPLWVELGHASVSDNGSVIILPLWGWSDEGGSSGMAVHDRDGNLVREILFRNAATENNSLRWISKYAVSPEGDMIVTGENGTKQSTITMFITATGNIAWTQNTSLGVVVDIVVSPKGDYSLVATRKSDNSDMAFTLLGRDGKILWSRPIAANFSYDEHYVRFSQNLHTFYIYDLKARRHISLPLPVQSPG